MTNGYEKPVGPVDVWTPQQQAEAFAQAGVPMQAANWITDILRRFAEARGNYARLKHQYPDLTEDQLNQLSGITGLMAEIQKTQPTTQQMDFWRTRKPLETVPMMEELPTMRTAGEQDEDYDYVDIGYAISVRDKKTGIELGLVDKNSGIFMPTLNLSLSRENLLRARLTETDLKDLLDRGVINKEQYNMAWANLYAQGAGGVTSLIPKPPEEDELVTTLTGDEGEVVPGVGGIGGEGLSIKPIARYEVVSEGGYDFLVGYDEDGNEVSRETLAKTGRGAARYETISEGGYDFLVGYDENDNIVSREPLGRTETGAITQYQQAQIDLANRQFEQDVMDAQRQYDLEIQRLAQDKTASDRDYQLAYQTLQQRISESQQQYQLQLQQFGFTKEEAQRQYELQQQQFGLSREQFEWQKQQAEAERQLYERQYAAQLAASPKSWLEYAGFTGETPTVQPWMLPLMPEQYAGTVAGSPLPGWEQIKTNLGQGVPTMSNLPWLTTPSTQYQARMGPTAYQQYAGYEQARTGIRPDELQWRLWSQAPPGGANRALAYSR